MILHRQSLVMTVGVTLNGMTIGVYSDGMMAGIKRTETLQAHRHMEEVLILVP